MKLAGCKVLVTGGARGIGRALVDGLVADGCSVGVFEKDEESCSLLINDFGTSVPTWKCDVSDPLLVNAAVQEAHAAGFQPDVLINNAGIIHSEPLVNITQKENRQHKIESWRHVLSADLDSVFFVSRQIVDDMIRRRCRGLVISISSVAAKGNAGQSAYSAAKAGVNALTITWAKEYGPLGIRFAAIAPGFLDLPSTEHAIARTSLDKIKQQIPLRRLGNTDAIYLATKLLIESDYITGTILEVDGGIRL